MAKKFERKTVYIYEINGQEKMRVNSAEEAEHWDVVFGVAEEVDQVLQDSPPDIKLDEAQRTELSLYLAQHRTELGAILADVEASEAPADKKDTKSQGSAKGTSKSAGIKDAKDDKSAVKKQSFVQDFKRPVEPSKDGFSI